MLRRILTFALLLLIPVLTSGSSDFDPAEFFSNERQQLVRERYGEEAFRRFRDWQQLFLTSQSLDDLEKLNAVNQFFNQLQFKNDKEVWRKADYWATPIEFTSIGAGDCEDFSIAKYFSLVSLGVDEKKLRITYVKALKINQAHMVLTYYPTPSAIPLVLDNLDGDIKPGNKRPDLVPIYSFNGQGLWLAKERGKGKRLGQSSEMEMWSDLSKRMQQGL